MPIFAIVARMLCRNHLNNTESSKDSWELVARITHKNKLNNIGPLADDQAPVPEKTISANRGLNPANRGIKFVLRLDCVPQNTISTISGIK